MKKVVAEKYRDIDFSGAKRGAVKGEKRVWSLMAQNRYHPALRQLARAFFGGNLEVRP